MEWHTIDYNGTKVQAADFLDGVVVVIEHMDEPMYCPGWYVQEARGDMDGPALREREKETKEFAIRLVEV
jgi:hypothetical protein